MEEMCTKMGSRHANERTPRFCPKGPPKALSGGECFAPFLTPFQPGFGFQALFHHEKCENVRQKWAKTGQVEDDPVSTRRAPQHEMARRAVWLAQLSRRVTLLSAVGDRAGPVEQNYLFFSSVFDDFLGIPEFNRDEAFRIQR